MISPIVPVNLSVSAPAVVTGPSGGEAFGAAFAEAVSKVESFQANAQTSATQRQGVGTRQAVRESCVRDSSLDRGACFMLTPLLSRTRPAAVAGAPATA